MLSILLLMSESDIYVGFLLVIDLGVGLVFFIFILHFTAFLYQKSLFHLNYRYSIYLWYGLFTYGLLLIYNSDLQEGGVTRDLMGLWYYKVVHIDYYLVTKSNLVTELTLLFDSYFNLNTFEFFLINCSLLFGLLSSILLVFTLHKLFNILNFSQLINVNLLSFVTSSFFIRNQNIATQQRTAGISKSWTKLKSKRKL